ncbi:hypothetical protein TNCV_3673901 [Trichonephila clavipes]|nr:hypothetical protein TNCV_3673901 [Trichonephila clavipes]
MDDMGKYNDREHGQEPVVEYWYLATIDYRCNDAVIASSIEGALHSLRNADNSKFVALSSSWVILTSVTYVKTARCLREPNVMSFAFNVYPPSE